MDGIMTGVIVVLCITFVGMIASVYFPNAKQKTKIIKKQDKYDPRDDVDALRSEVRRLREDMINLGVKFDSLKWQELYRNLEPVIKEYAELKGYDCYYNTLDRVVFREYSSPTDYIVKEEESVELHKMRSKLDELKQLKDRLCCKKGSKK
jgi:hypothetical protein